MIDRALAGLIRWVSLFFRAMGWRACRFHPTCSEYAAGALGRFSTLKALGISAARLLRCHPFSPGGFDPLPEKDV